MAGGRSLQGQEVTQIVVGTLQKRPAKAGGRSPKGPLMAGTTVVMLEPNL